MAAKKKPAAKEELQTWSVVSNGQEMDVEADSMEIDNGALLFWIEEGVSRAFAPGAWSTVERHEVEPV